MGIWGNPAATTEPRAQLHKPVKKNFFYSSWGGALAPGAPPCLRHCAGEHLQISSGTAVWLSRAQKHVNLSKITQKFVNRF